MTPVRRAFLQSSALSGASLAWPWLASAQTPVRQFTPQPGAWRSFDVTTRVDLLSSKGSARVWLPIPAVNSDWQRSLDSTVASNGRTEIVTDSAQGVRMLVADFAESEARPFIELTSRVQTRSRAVDWASRTPASLEAASVQAFTHATALLPVDGIVRETAQKAVQGARSDAEQVRKLYDWVVSNAWREPKVKGCGEGDIKTMLETGDLGGKCADLNALFVGLCRSLGIPARDVYGLRLAPSAFGYKELGGNPASLKGAQHCRAEVFLKDFGWVAMDPADVAKVMRQETAQWIKNPQDPVVAPVAKGLFGGWEGNWLGWNTAHDVKLPGLSDGPLGFFMYPVAQNALGRLDSYSPDDFKYQISAREVSA